MSFQYKASCVEKYLPRCEASWIGDMSSPVLYLEHHTCYQCVTERVDIRAIGSRPAFDVFPVVSIISSKNTERKNCFKLW